MNLSLINPHIRLAIESRISAGHNIAKRVIYDYELVYFNSGIHAHGQSVEEYKRNYTAVLRRIRELLPKVPIILGLSTPLTEGNTAEAGTYDTPVSLDETVRLTEQNKTVVGFNRAVLEIAEEEVLEVFDAYSLMLENTQYKKADGVHFTPEGYALLSSEIISKIKNIINTKRITK